MTHDEYLSRLDDLVDRRVPAGELHALEGHAQGCEPCREATAAAIALLEAARGLPRAIAPEVDAWGRIEGVLRGGTRAGVGALAVPVRPRSVAAAWLLAASLALAVGVLWVRSRVAVSDPRSAVTFERDAFAGLVSGLELECDGAGQALQASFRRPGTGGLDAAAAATPALSAAVEILDQAIAETGTALAQTPEDARLQALLAARYKQKLALLSTALVRMEKV